MRWSCSPGFTSGTAGGAIDAYDVVDKQFLQGLSLVDVAERRASREDLARIAEDVEALATGARDEAAYVAFEEQFWRDVARAGKNRIFEMEVAWWYRVVPRHPRAEQFTQATLEARLAFYRELARRLARGDDAVGFYRRKAWPPSSPPSPTRHDRR